MNLSYLSKNMVISFMVTCACLPSVDALPIFGRAERQGKITRPNHIMEDRIHVGDVVIGDTSGSFFAVYDGHFGSEVVDYVKAHVHEYVIEELRAMLAKQVVSCADALHNAIMRVERETCEQQLSGGSCAIIALIFDGKLYIANVGDSRAVLFEDSVYGAGRAVALSYDHTLEEHGDEHNRIINAGGELRFIASAKKWCISSRNFPFSRAIGDHTAKKEFGARGFIAEPQITVRELTPADQFLILASDGLWDFAKNNVAVSIVNTALAEQQEAYDFAAEQLINFVWGCPGRDHAKIDDTAVIVVKLNT